MTVFIVTRAEHDLQSFTFHSVWQTYAEADAYVMSQPGPKNSTMVRYSVNNIPDLDSHNDKLIQAAYNGFKITEVAFSTGPTEEELIATMTTAELWTALDIIRSDHHRIAPMTDKHKTSLKLLISALDAKFQ